MARSHICNEDFNRHISNRKANINFTQSFHTFFIFFCSTTFVRKQSCWWLKPAFLAPICILDCHLLLLGIHSCKPLCPGASSRRCYLLFGTIPFPFFPQDFCFSERVARTNRNRWSLVLVNNEPFFLFKFLIKLLIPLKQSLHLIDDKFSSILNYW